MRDRNGSSRESVSNLDQKNLSKHAQMRARKRKRRFELRFQPEGCYLTEAHFSKVKEAVKALKASRSLVFVSENFAIAKYYKELCISRLRNDPAIKLLSFDPRSGPDLLSIINAQLKDTSLDEMIKPSRARSSKQLRPNRCVLIVDSEDLVTQSDWQLIATLSSQLASANIGVLRLEPHDRFSVRSSGTSVPFSLSVEFDLPRERELRVLEALAVKSSKGDEMVRLINNLELDRSTSRCLSSDEIEQEVNPKSIVKDTDASESAPRLGTKGRQRQLFKRCSHVPSVVLQPLIWFLPSLIVLGALLITVYFNQ